MMDRRTFNRLMGWSPLAVAGWRGISAVQNRPEPVKAAPLRRGSRIGLIAPGSPFSSEQLDRAIENIQALDLEVELGTHLMEEKGYLAGTDKKRLTDLQEMFRRSDIDGIWCIRGGYGCTRLLPLIDYDLIRKHPKVFVGFSDITALHNAFFRRAGLITFHAPVASSTWTDYAKEYLQGMLFENELSTLQPVGESKSSEDALAPFTLQGGMAQGKLSGGNLSLLSVLAGTEYGPTYKGKIVCLEEIGEKPYRIDRMLTHLFQATDIREAAAVLLGRFVNCSPDEEDRSLSLRETLELCFEEMECPVSYGWDFGHIDDQFTIPIGARVRIDTDEQLIYLMESPLQR